MSFRYPIKEREAIRKHIRDTYGYDGDLLDLFVNNTKFPIQKWHHYLPIYDRYFSPFKNKPIRFLEIGVWNGGSMQMWRKFFGNEAMIYGIDIEPQCAQFNGIHGQVRIGDQSDADFLLSVVKEMGGVDIVLDDGSHIMQDVKNSLQALLPHVTDKGIYMIEDMLTAYAENYGGGYDADGNIFSFLRDIIDDMHKDYHKMPAKVPHISQHCHSIHVYNAIVVIEKGKQTYPYDSVIG